jgi:cold shock CspA family protein/ribosome-associated translation inhibitor RaiA
VSRAEFPCRSGHIIEINYDLVAPSADIIMQLPLQLSFRNMEPSEAIEAVVRKKAAKLDSFASDIMSCRVVIEPAGRHHLHGNSYEVHLNITLPCGEIAITRGPSEHVKHQDITLAVRNAFDSARRKLEDHVRRQGGAVKAHRAKPFGRVTKLFPDEGYGFLVTADAREVYFHRNCVLGEGFDRLQIGAEVAFVEEEGAKGPQATIVKPGGKHNHL